MVICVTILRCRGAETLTGFWILDFGFFGKSPLFWVQQISNRSFPMSKLHLFVVQPIENLKLAEAKFKIHRFSVRSSHQRTCSRRADGDAC